MPTTRDKFLNFDMVLCLSPHPDDVEYGMLGTVLTYPETTFVVVTMSAGTPGDRTTGDKRLDEVKQCWGGIPNVALIFTGIYNLEDEKERAWLFYLESRVESIDYDAIIAPASHDTHYEHLMVNRIGRAMTRSHPVSFLEYKTASVLSPPWAPNILVNIANGVFHDKLYRIKNHGSQAHRGYFAVDAVAAFHIDYTARKRGTHYWSEQFCMVKHYI